MPSSSSIRSRARVLKQWDWGLFLLILFYMAMPRLYQSYSIYLVGNAIPDTNALATVAQWQFVGLLLEVIQETFVLAIFYFVGRGMQSRQGPGGPIRTSLTTILTFTTAIAAVLFIFSDSFVAVIGTPPAIAETTSAFLRIKTAAMPLFLLAAASVTIVETVNRKRYIFTLAILQVVYRFILDSLFYGGYAFSLDLGVLGVAWADAAANLALFVTAMILLRPVMLDKIKGWASFFTFKDWRTYLRVGGWSGLDSLVRNVAYFFLIVRLLNLLGEDYIGGYYLAMHIFWSFLLVPVLALAETAKVLIANHSADIQFVRRLWYSSLAIGGAIVLVWLVLLPLWDNFAELLNSNGEVVRYSSKAMSLLIVPYVLMALNLVADAIFY